MTDLAHAQFSKCKMSRPHRSHPSSPVWASRDGTPNLDGVTGTEERGDGGESAAENTYSCCGCCYGWAILGRARTREQDRATHARAQTQETRQGGREGGRQGRREIERATFGETWPRSWSHPAEPPHTAQRKAQRRTRPDEWAGAVGQRTPRGGARNDCSEGHAGALLHCVRGVHGSPCSWRR